MLILTDNSSFIIIVIISLSNSLCSLIMLSSPLHYCGQLHMNFLVLFVNFNEHNSLCSLGLMMNLIRTNSHLLKHISFPNS